MTSPISHFLKTVCLKDWWLAKDEKESCSGGKLLVGGSVPGRQRAVREFLSAPIVKRHDLFTLETTDGIFIILNGSINKQHTCDNGFSSELFNHFMIGFPFDWEESAEKCCGVHFSGEAVSKANSDQESAADAAVEKAAPLLTQLRKTNPCQSSERCREDPNLESQDNLMSQSVQRKPFLRDSSHLQHCTVQEHVIKQISRDENVLVKNTVNTPVLEVGFKLKLGNYHSNSRSRERPGHAESVVNSDFSQANHDAADRSLLNEIDSNANDSMDTTTTSRLNIQSSSVAGPDDNKGSHTQGSTYESLNVLSTSDCQGFKKSKIQKVRTQEDNSSAEGSSQLKIPSFKHAHDGSSYCPKSCKWSLRSTSTRTDAKTKSSGDFVGSASKTGNSNVKNGSKTAAAAKHSNANKTSRKRNKRRISARAGAKSKSRDALVGSTYRLCNSNVKNGPRTSVIKEGTAYESSSMYRKKAKRKLEYYEQITLMLDRKKRSPAVLSSPSTSTLKTSRSGRVLLPTMEFWRNQLPIYDFDRELSGIKEGSSVLKIERGRRRG